MTAMIGAPRATRLLWLVLALTLPLPYWALEWGIAPPVRMLFLGSLVLGMVLSGPSMLSLLFSTLYLVQGVLWLGLTALLARIVVRRLSGGEGVARGRLAAAIAVLVLLALLPVYQLPMSSAEHQTNWLGLFR